ncbi:12771_t:CDS:2, partial [Funneliformis geosporum]
MGKIKSTKKDAEAPSNPTSSQIETKTSRNKYTEKEIMNVLQYILDHYEDWINKKRNQRKIIIKALDHYDMKDRTPYAVHFKVCRLKFEYKKYGKINGFSSIINEMVARILNGVTDDQQENRGVDIVKINQDDKQSLDDRNDIREAISKKTFIDNMNAINEPKETTFLPVQEKKSNSAFILNDYGLNKGSLLVNSSGITSNEQHKPQMSNKFKLIQPKSDNNHPYLILPATYTFMEKAIVDELYKRKLCEIRERCQGIRNENNRNELVQIGKLDQSYNEIIYLLGRIEARMVEMQTGHSRIYVIVYFIKKLGYCHKDFHSGNILQDKQHSYISDFGLTGPADKQSNDKIYGVLPYIAPEVLNGESYTLTSDIYSFGVIMTELSTGNPPFYDRKHDVSLALDI